MSTNETPQDNRIVAGQWLEYLLTLTKESTDRDFKLVEADYQVLLNSFASELNSPRTLLLRSVPFSIFRATTLSNKSQSLVFSSNLKYANTVVPGNGFEGLKIALAEGGKDLPGICVYGFRPNINFLIEKDPRRNFTYQSQGEILPEDLYFVLLRFPKRNIEGLIESDDESPFSFVAYRFVHKEKSAAS